MSDSASTLDNRPQSGVHASSIRTETDDIIRNDTIIIDPEKGTTQASTDVTHKDGSGGYKIESTTDNSTGDYTTTQTTYDSNGNVISEGTVSQQDGVYMERGDTDIISEKPTQTFPTEEQEAEWEREEAEPVEETERPEENTDPEAEAKETECDTTCKVTSFAVGLIKGAAMAAAVIGVMALAAAISPAVATAAGVLAIGAGVYGAYQLFTGWGSMSTQQKWETAGGFVGGLWAGIRGIRGPKQPKIPKPEPAPKPQSPQGSPSHSPPKPPSTEAPIRPPRAPTSTGLTVQQLRNALRSASEPYKGSTRVGHALNKHAGRKPEIWGKIKGNMDTWHKQAMTHFREIMRGPGKFEQVHYPGKGTWLEKRLPDGRGIRLNLDGSFKGFID